MAKKAKVEKSVLDLSGSYYNPERSGWGLFVTNYSEDTQSIQIFTYNEQGDQLWFVGVGPRGSGNFTLFRPTAAWAFDNIRAFDTGESVGRIDLDLVEPGKLSYKALISNKVINPGLQFSPVPPDWHEFEGVLTKIGYQMM